MSENMGEERQSEMDRAQQDLMDGYLKGVQNEAPKLPSNFSWLVMRRILLVKANRAQRRAVWEASLVTLATLGSAALLFLAYTQYTGVQALAVPTAGLLILPAAAVFSLVFLIDAAASVYWNGRDSI
jgi:hypothetical protein